MCVGVMFICVCMWCVCVWCVYVYVCDCINAGRDLCVWVSCVYMCACTWCVCVLCGGDVCMCVHVCLWCENCGGVMCVYVYTCVPACYVCCVCVGVAYGWYVYMCACTWCVWGVWHGGCMIWAGTGNEVTWRHPVPKVQSQKEKIKISQPRPSSKSGKRLFLPFWKFVCVVLFLRKNIFNKRKH